MTRERKLTRSLTPAGAWAFSIGTSIGWGSLVVTSSTYLAQAGPWGSAAGMVLGGLVMVLISVNYAYLMNIYPEAGGAYAYTREVFGHDHGFLTAWFLTLTYLAILWANATSLPLFARYFLGDRFRVVKLYTVFGYDVYLGEALLSAAAIVAVALLCCRWKRALARAMVVMAALFTAGLTVCFVWALAGHGLRFEPGFVPGSGGLSQVVRIAVISPWAFIGFENISHATEEVGFQRTRFFRVLVVSVAMSTALYIFVTLLSATAYPPQFDSWLDYIRARESLSGIEGLPAFYAARHYMGGAGVAILMLVLLSLIVTSLIGNITAVSRLFYALGRDGVLPKRYGALNRFQAPGRAIMLVAGVSVLFPFLGRTVIGWIVDVTTLGATLIYGLVSAAAMALANARRDRMERATGVAGTVLMVLYGLYLLVPNLFTAGQMAPESYLLFMVWAVAGLLYFHFVLLRQPTKRFGNSIVVWLALFSTLLFVALVWLTQSLLTAAGDGMRTVEAHYLAGGAAEAGGAVVAQALENVRRIGGRNAVGAVALLAVTLGVLISNFRAIRGRALDSELQLGVVREQASRDALTGVKSRGAFAEKERELDEAIARGEAGLFALVLCDLNGLKFVNDTLGHQAGDERIKQACRMICELYDHSPVYRNGGDEFVVYLSGRDYEARNDKLRALHEQSVANIQGGGVVVSGGMSEFQAKGDSRVKQVFERADKAMYAEKMALKRMGAPTRGE